jgi:hypothetical protein
MSKEIPESPKPEVVEDKSEERVKGWVDYFKRLSPRLKVIEPTDEEFQWVMDSSLLFAKDRIDRGREEYIADWPKPEEVLFVVVTDSSLVGHEPKFMTEDVRIFCVNRAFGPDYFYWDGDGEEDPDCRSYSLSSYSEKALSWNYVAKLIKDNLTRISKAVPKVPKEPPE